MNGADTLSMCLHDYQASLHHWSEAHRSDDEPGEPPEAAEVDAMFRRMASSGIARIH